MLHTISPAQEVIVAVKLRKNKLKTHQWSKLVQTTRRAVRLQLKCTPQNEESATLECTLFVRRGKLNSHQQLDNIVTQNYENIGEHLPTLCIVARTGSLLCTWRKMRSPKLESMATAGIELSGALEY